MIVYIIGVILSYTYNLPTSVRLLFYLGILWKVVCGMCRYERFVNSDDNDWV